MKKIASLLCALFLVLSASYGLAETGDGMTKGDEGKSDEMKEFMMTTMKHMSSMMDKMSVMIKTMPNEKMPKMQKMMEQMRAQMRDLSRMMMKKTGTKKEMSDIQKRKHAMEEVIHEMETGP